MTDVIDEVLSLSEGDELWHLRRTRPLVLEHLQGGYDAIYDPESQTLARLSLDERAAVALRVCVVAEADALANHYLQRIEDLELARCAGIGESADPRTQVILDFATLVAGAPEESGLAEIESLRSVGLDDTAIITLSQLIAFTSFQLRVVHGLHMIGY
jgi:uncharacterized protein YciW